MNVPEQDSPPPRKNDSGLVAGLTLIGLGLLFLLVNVTDFHIGNWPAVFMLLPGGLLLAQVVTVSRREGGIYRTVRPSLIGGLVLIVIGCLMLLHMSLLRYWPLVLIAVGLGMTIARNPRPNS